VFDYPPFNIVDAAYSKPCRISSREWTPARACGSSYSKGANPEFYLATLILTRQDRHIMTAVGASGLPILMTRRASHQVCGGQHCETEAASGA